MLSGLPNTIADVLCCGAVDEQVERPIRKTIRDMDGQCLLPTAQRLVIRHGPVQVCHLLQAGHHPGRLAQRQLEEDPDRQAELDRHVGEHCRATGAAVMWREPDHLLVQPALR